MKTLLVDAYDSFVYIIFYYLQCLDMDVSIVRFDRLSPGSIESSGPDAIVLGPGPGRPEYTNYATILGAFSGLIPILGVCLGHQAIGQFYGYDLRRARRLVHGKTSLITHDGKGCFRGFGNEAFEATRYHSLSLYPKEEANPGVGVVTARSDDGEIMGFRVESQMVESVQFHPESVNTKDGLVIFDNFFRSYIQGTNRLQSAVIRTSD